MNNQITYLNRDIYKKRNEIAYLHFEVQELEEYVQIEKEKEDEEKRIIHNNIEQEMECPRCHDIMALSSDFDRLSYVCQECNLSLLLY